MVTYEKMIMTMMMVLIMSTILTSVVQAAVPQPPSLDYCCPLEPSVCFATYDELYAHFVTAHPAEDIDIIWD